MTFKNGLDGKEERCSLDEPFIKSNRKTMTHFVVCSLPAVIRYELLETPSTQFYVCFIHTATKTYGSKSSEKLLSMIAFTFPSFVTDQNFCHTFLVMTSEE